MQENTAIFMACGDHKFMAPSVHDSAVASQPCPSGHITSDKRLRYASPKLPSANSFIRKPYMKFRTLAVREKIHRMNKRKSVENKMYCEVKT